MSILLTPSIQIVLQSEFVQIMKTHLQNVCSNVFKNSDQIERDLRVNAVAEMLLYEKDNNLLLNIIWHVVQKTSAPRPWSPPHSWSRKRCSCTQIYKSHEHWTTYAAVNVQKITHLLTPGNGASMSIGQSDFYIPWPTPPSQEWRTFFKTRLT